MRSAESVVGAYNSNSGKISEPSNKPPESHIKADDDDNRKNI